MYDLLCVLFLVVVPAIFSSSLQPSVQLGQGLLKGKYETTLNNRKISSFLGIPYAEPPISKLRFEAPVAASKWSGILNATILPPECLQYSHMTYKYDFCQVTGSEDCLYLNVYTPKLFDGSEVKLMDVIVYIHPGAFMYFSSSYSSPTALLDRDVVFVTFNYRLGVLGFLSTGDHVVPGNNGLKDQILALQWVKKNIRTFGGDPDRVTIAGLDAGAASVHYHLLSPLSKGLFKSAISASGSALCPWAIAENVREKAAKIADELGCPTGDSKSMVDCLRNRPASSIVGFSKIFIPWLYNPFAPFGPVVEQNGPTAFISDSPLNIIKKGKVNNVPWLVSFTSDQGLYPAAELLGTKSYITEMEQSWEELLPHLLDFNYTVAHDRLAEVSKAIKDHYKINLQTAEGKKNFIQLFSDRLYLQGITHAAKLHAAQISSPVYMYKFSYPGRYSVSDTMTKFQPVERYGVCHGDDMIYLLPMPWFHLNNQDDIAMSILLRDIWVNFATKGKLDWSPVNDDLSKLLVLNIEGPDNLEQTVTKDYSQDEFWLSLNIKENIISNNRDEL
ncbi:venom carboxylesterase-6 [Halyomorpha halys]|uniref:venom carboxylesterase-6 n=1 Tax=Halyomorpha halys TaxID=286706 RepID=UPI0006D4C8E0|nr:venom carboxylesterase-6-like [Halyomorpha halys]